jgi:hypothetical protein
MILPISEAPVSELLSRFVRHRELRMDAVRRLDVPAANRHFLAAAAAAESLARTVAGRSALERLLDHPTVHLRVAAGSYVIDWAPAEVVPLFGRLLDADLSSIESPAERSEIRLDAMEWLYKHLGVNPAIETGSSNP